MEHFLLAISDFHTTFLKTRIKATFCRFRLNNHKLPIEYGRWNNIPRELRICNLCNTADLGDEFHYLLKCDYFSEKRKTYIDNKIL